MPQGHAFLVRHASRESNWAQPGQAHRIARKGSTPTPGSDKYSDERGSPLTYALAGVLCDKLDLEGITVTKILHSESTVAEQTADVFATVLTERQKTMSPIAIESCPDLTPRNRRTGDEDPKRERVVDRIDPDNRSSGCLVVGHQPQLTQISRALTKGSLPGNVLPLGGSEIAGIDLEESRLEWLITQKSDEILEDLETKLQSKYDVAKFILGAFFVAFGLALEPALWDVTGVGGAVGVANVALVALGAVFTFLSLGFTAATLFSYDRLTMPSTFWSEADGSTEQRPWSVQRPPTQEHLILFYEMVHIWSHLFLPALVFAFAALGSFVVSLALRSVSSRVEAGDMNGLLLVTLSVIIALLSFTIPVVIYARWKPKLGFND